MQSEWYNIRVSHSKFSKAIFILWWIVLNKLTFGIKKDQFQCVCAFILCVRAFFISIFSYLMDTKHSFGFLDHFKSSVCRIPWTRRFPCARFSTKHNVRCQFLFFLVLFHSFLSFSVSIFSFRCDLCLWVSLFTIHRVKKESFQWNCWIQMYQKEDDEAYGCNIVAI